MAEREIRKVTEKYGAESLWTMKGTGRDINGYGVHIAGAVGSPNGSSAFLSGLACYAPRIFSTGLKIGSLLLCDYSQFFPDRYEDPRFAPPEYIVIWGNNPVIANSDGTLGHWVRDCMKLGAKLIVIDPKLTWLAGRAEHFLQIRPGTDCALAMAMGNVICSENLFDHEFVEKWCTGFAEYAAAVKTMSPEKAAEICGIDAEDIIAAARAFGTAKRASLQWGVSLDHATEGFLNGMAVMDLVALTGNIEKPGTMVIGKPCFDVGQTWMIGGDFGPGGLSEKQEAKRINDDFPALQSMGVCSTDMLAETLLTGKPYPIKATWIQTANPITCMGPDSHMILEGLQGTDFNVVVDLFMTPTALAVADLILPASMFAEREGLSGHQPYYLGAIVKAIEPQGECRSDQQIIVEFSKRFAPEDNPWKNDIELYDYLLQEEANAPFNYEQLKERTWAYPEFEYYKHEKGLLRADGQPGFNTASGLYEFKCDTLELFDLETVPKYVEPIESPVNSPELAKKYPLVLTTGARKVGLFHSEHRQSKYMRRIHPGPEAIINPVTAAQYGIKNGDWIKIENNFGECKMQAVCSKTMKEGVVAADHAWWFPERGADDGTLFGNFESNINCCLPMRPGKSGLGSSYKSVLCAVSKCDAPNS